MNTHNGSATHTAIADLRSDGTTLAEAHRSEVVDIPPGGSFELRVHLVAKRIGDAIFPMLAYNGSIPGPTLRVRQGSEVAVTIINETTAETTVHWHGLRLQNAYDGVPHATQAPVPPGGSYTHRLTFPDPGTFWYHPHMREDFAQEMGLYGNVVVDPADPSYWPPADRDVLLPLDDILIEDGRITAFDPRGANFAAMGRFGNVMLVGGETSQRLEVRRGEVVRFHFTNTANTRVFKVGLPGLRMKLVGGDAGRYEREQWVSDVMVAPSERALVDVLFGAAGAFPLQHVTPERAYALAEVVVEPAVETRSAAEFATLRVSAEMVAERERASQYLQAPPDKSLALVAEMDFEQPANAGTRYACPMHPEVVTDEPGKCPKCGMKLMPTAAGGHAAAGHGHGSTGHGHGHDHGGSDVDMLEGGVEWEDLMLDVNRGTTAATMRWKAVDRDTGKANADIDWRFAVGEQVKVRIVNEMESDHPMHHPFHIHGERFLVLARDGVAESNLVWKDTVLVRTGETVDILLDASNPGTWMAHCHIAEHMEVGMMFDFVVAPAAGAGGAARTG